MWADVFHALAVAGGPPVHVLMDSSAVKAHRSAGLPPEQWSTHWVRFDPFLKRTMRWQASERRQKISSLSFGRLKCFRVPPLQRTESMVSEEVIRQSVRAAIPVLNIHDGFVVPVEEEFEVRGFMEGAFRALELESIPKIK